MKFRLTILFLGLACFSRTQSPAVMSVDAFVLGAPVVMVGKVTSINTLIDGDSHVIVSASEVLRGPHGDDVGRIEEREWIVTTFAKEDALAKLMNGHRFLFAQGAEGSEGWLDLDDSKALLSKSDFTHFKNGDETLAYIRSLVRRCPNRLIESVSVLPPAGRRGINWVSQQEKAGESSYSLRIPIQPGILLHAHAHNDYEHRRPLTDALSHGFTSIEADVFLVDGRLLVAHDRKNLHPSRSLKSLYLEPLAILVRERGHVYPNVELTLMVDIKADGPEATRALIKELEPYRWMISTVIPRQVKVVVSGVGDREVIARESSRLLSIDGRPTDLEKARDRNIAWVSDNWSNHFKWTGEGNFSESEVSKLRAMALRAQWLGYRLRFWGTPESPAVWAVLRQYKVDLIGTDHLSELAKFLNRGPV